MVELIILIPFITGVLAFFIPKNMGRMLLVITGVAHLFFSLMLWALRPEALYPAYFAVTPEGLLSLIVISLLFFLVSIYSTSYLKMAELESEPVFIGSMLLFLSTMTMVTVSDHIMVMWIAIEATTLASAPLIYTYRTAKALEATWKYVLICSVGIAMALLGSVLITVAMDAGHVEAPVSFSALTDVATRLDPFWLKAGFVFILVGYGTKMGLAPMHTWLPDAHSEAPSPASALLSGVLLNCAYLGIFKTHKVMVAAGLGAFSGGTLMFFGILSILAAATYILKQSEYKRLLAYSSIENMGIIAFGTGVGGIGVYGAMLCLIHHSLIKSSLFLTSGNILLGYGCRIIQNVGDLVTRMPRTFVVFFAGFAAISGFPPFGMFLGEMLIIIGTFQAGHHAVACLFIASLCVIFAGFCYQIMSISFDETTTAHRLHVTNWMLWPQYALLATSLVLSFWMPETLYRTIAAAVRSIGGGY
ncbi:proton-conducting transporter membrane subunit [Desulfobotulus sp.]|jgi:hydrogenase-4 component F|uniref:proton-conducting transporter transmembrane domain-containing protein n=1 Tax=Desulfobotulus sp. TaxID=1940337 RepID=UPI002A3624CE|nr:proton-conducting transporter membrane subunit [Desulfobotulus sp.]MDY0162207.1 proton-conducting transporter membrane subunit [Desulfobotulus sp.]